MRSIGSDYLQFVMGSRLYMCRNGVRSIYWTGLGPSQLKKTRMLISIVSRPFMDDINCIIDFSRGGVTWWNASVKFWWGGGLLGQVKSVDIKISFSRGGVT